MTRKNLTDNGSHLDNGLEATKSGVSQSKRQVQIGDITWIKIRKSSWWPAQVVDDKNVDCNLKKKAKDEILVRLYGTYDYLYVDPVKSSSEFQNIVEQENNTARAEFQKALEEDLSHTKEAANSKRKVSLSEASKRKRQKQDKIVINLEEDEDDGPVSEAIDKEKPRDKAGRDKRTNQDVAKKTKATNKGAASRDENRELNQDIAKNTKATNKGVASRDENGKPKAPKLNRKSVGGAFKDKTGKQKEMQVIEKAGGGASKNKHGKSKEAGGERKERAEAHPNTNSPNSPIPTQLGTSEQTPRSSARRVRVMQKLGLIAPTGSPFCKKTNR